MKANRLIHGRNKPTTTSRLPKVITFYNGKLDIKFGNSVLLRKKKVSSLIKKQ